MNSSKVCRPRHSLDPDQKIVDLGAIGLVAARCFWHLAVFLYSVLQNRSNRFIPWHNFRLHIAVARIHRLVLYAGPAGILRNSPNGMPRDSVVFEADHFHNVDMLAIRCHGQEARRVFDSSDIHIRKGAFVHTLSVFTSSMPILTEKSTHGWL